MSLALPKGPFRTKNATALNSVVFYYRRSFLLSLAICCLPLKFIDYILNSQKYFHVTYVMDYMAITYFYSPIIFLCNGGTPGIPLKFMDTY